MNLDRLTTPQRVSAIAMLVVVLGSFLPWVSIFGISVSGIRGDGAITLFLAAAGLGLLAVTTGLFGAPRGSGTAASIGMIVLAAITALIGLVDMSGAAAIGLYLTLFAGIAWVVGAVWHLIDEKNAKAAAAGGEDQAQP